MSRGADLIIEERLRQISDEGMTFGHDDNQAPGVLSAAADCYLFLTHTVEAAENCGPLVWPFHPSWWKPSSAERNLVKAGALYAAESERCGRHGDLRGQEECRRMVQRIARHIDEMAYVG